MDSTPSPAGPALGTGYTIVGDAVTRGSFVTAVIDASHFTLSKLGTLSDRALIGVPPAAVVTGSIGPASNVLNVSAVSSGSLAVGQSITGPNVTSGTTITAFGPNTSGGIGTYTVSASQTVAANTLMGVAPVAAVTAWISGNTLNVTAVSGGALAVGQSVFGKGVAANTIITGYAGPAAAGSETYTIAPYQTATSTTFTPAG